MKSYGTRTGTSEPQNKKKRQVLPGDKERPLDLHQRKQGELPKEDTAQSKSAARCGTDMEEGTAYMDLADVDNDNKETLAPYKVGKDKLDTYKNIDFFKLGEDHSLIKDAKKKSGAGK